MTAERSILVAVDLPPERADFGPVFELATATGWSVHILHAAAPEPAFVGYDASGGIHDSYQRDRELAHEYDQLTEHVALFASEGIKATAHVEIGQTVELILSKADEWNAAFVVVVGHKHNVAHRLVLGSVASTLLKVARQPVLVLPAPEAPDDEAIPSVDRLIEVIDREDSDAELVGLREAAEAHLASPSSEEGRQHLGGRLVDALQGFELSHPSITRAINDVSYYLSGLGI